MAYAYTWDPAAPLNTALVSDGARVMREDIKGALNERLLSVFTNLTADPLVHSKVLVQATGKINLDGSTAGDTYIRERLANVMTLTAGGADAFEVTALGVWIGASSKLWLDGGGDTYIIESAANIMRFFAGGVNTFSISATTAAFGGTSETLGTTNRFYLDSGSDTYIFESSADAIGLVAGANTQLTLTTTYAQFFQSVVVGATKLLYFDGGSDTYLTESSANVLKMYVGGVELLNCQATFMTVNQALVVAATKKFYLDGLGDTYIQEGAANQLVIAAGDGAASGTISFATGGTNNLYVANDVVRLGGVAGTGVVILGHATQGIKFYSSGSTGTTKQAVTGAKGGNVALANLMTALATVGLLTDSTT